MLPCVFIPMQVHIGGQSTVEPQFNKATVHLGKCYVTEKFT